MLFFKKNKYFEFEISWNNAYLLKLFSITILSWDGDVKELDLFDIQILKLSCWLIIKF